MIIYKATNKINQKIYVGQTSQSLRERVRRHFKDKRKIGFRIALKKYGLQNFDFETMAYCDTKKKLDFLERFYIKFFKSKTPLGYNLTDGGDGRSGFVTSQGTKRKMSNAHTGIIYIPLGRHRSKETRRKISEGHKRRKVYAEITGS